MARLYVRSALLSEVVSAKSWRAEGIIPLAPADALLPGRYTCVGRRKKNRGPQASMSFPNPHA